jgi:hypothetical protein
MLDFRRFSFHRGACSQDPYARRRECMDSGFANADGVQAQWRACWRRRNACARRCATQQREQNRCTVHIAAYHAHVQSDARHVGDGARDALLVRRECAEAHLGQRDRVVFGYAATMCIIGAAGFLSVANLSSFGSTQSS